MTGYDAERPRVRAERRGDVLRLVLDRPQRRNALDRKAVDELAGRLREADEDHGVGAVVLAAEPPAFSAGADLDELAALGGDEPRALGERFEALLDVLQHRSVPVVAAVDGAAVGLGATLLLHCDLVVVGPDARMRFPFVPLGVTVEAAASALLPLLVGPQQAARLLLTGDWVPADEAVTLGLAVARTTGGPAAGLAEALADRIAGQPRESVRVTRRLLGSLRAPSVDAARAQEREAWARLRRPRPTDPREERR